jgi:hypothetical protein
MPSPSSGITGTVAVPAWAAAVLADAGCGQAYLPMFATVSPAVPMTVAPPDRMISRPNKDYASLSVGKAALRAYVHVLHDQLAGTGVHATIVTITEGIGSEPRFDAPALAQAYLELHNQPETEWQPELVI